MMLARRQTAAPALAGGGRGVTAAEAGPEAEARLAVHRGWPEVEQALEAGRLRAAWEALLPRDPAATFFQTPLWCVTWYRSYYRDFEPLLLAAAAGGRLVGLAPLAVERAGGRIVFAGEHMSDYRDFLCDGDGRAAALDLFLPYLLAQSPGARLVIGQMQAESPTVEHLRRWAAGQRHCRLVLRTHPCQRVRLQSREELRQLYRKKTIRQALAHYGRHGGLRYRRLRDLHEWHSLKDAYFRQHSLRQAFAGRPLAFADPRKRSFYSSLFESQSPDIHFSGLWLGERPISFMFCVGHRDVLYYGAPSIDPLERKHSPGLLHLLEVMTRCREDGFQEMDLTMGASSFKGRLGNYSVDLPTLYVYGRRRHFWLDRTRKTGADWAKRLLRRPDGSDRRWEAIKAGLARLRAFLQAPAGRQPVASLRLVARRVTAAAYESVTSEIFELRPGGLHRVTPILAPGERCEFRRNRIEDFLTLEGGQETDLPRLVRTAVERIGQGHALHTVLINGRLAHFGWAYRPEEPLRLPETRTEASLPPDAVSLYDYVTVDAYRGRRLYPANLSQILREAFDGQAAAAYIVCDRRNLPSKRGIERVGFRRVAVHRLRRIFGWRWTSVEAEPQPAVTAAGAAA